MAVDLLVNFIGKNHLSKTTAVASRDLKKLGNTAKSVGNTINKSLGAVGLGIGFAALANGLKNATKAASDDRKSQGLLANALEKTVGATSQAIAGAENYIRTTQLSTAVLDDELRPALASTVRATGSLSKGQRLLDIALDISAETGKDLGSVTGSLSKAYGGNLGALKRLVPGIQLTADWMGQLETLYEGTAEKAANLDPYKRLEAVFADLQEEIGMALLPALEQFTEYLTTSEGQKNIREIVDGFVAVGKAVGVVIEFLIKNADAIKAVVTSILFLKGTWELTTLAVKAYYIMTGNAVKATKLLRTAMITTGIGAVVVLLAQLAEGWLNADSAQEEYFADPTAASGDFTIAEWAEKNKDKLIPDWSDEWLQLGYDSYGAYLQGMYEAAMANDAKQAAIDERNATLTKERRDKAVRDAKETADKIRAALNSKIEQMKTTAENFRDAVNLSFGLFGNDEYSVFNVDVFKAKLQRMVNAAKGFAANLARIAKIPNSQPIVDQLIAMGPVEGNIAARALLASGDLSEIVGLQASLYNTGTQAGARQATMGNATYEININKAVISAADIIREIRLLEKRTGRKYLVG
jgi:hypothetical protein